MSTMMQQQQQRLAQQHRHRHRTLPSRGAAAARSAAGRSHTRAAAAEPATASSSSSSSREQHRTQRLKLSDPLTGAAIHVFGVDHRYSQPDIAAWVLRARPAALVAETACTPQHGLAAATALDAASPGALGAPGPSAFFLRMFAQVASTLRQQLLDSGMKHMQQSRGEQQKNGEEPMRVSSDEAYERAVADALNEKGGLWAQASQNFNGEQLAYVSALAVGAPVLFGDRPKEMTYRRMWQELSAEDLDAAYEDERVREALEELRGMAEEWKRRKRGENGENGASELPASVAAALAAGEAGIAPVRADGTAAGSEKGKINAVERIMYLEREAVMCAVLSLACQRAAERRRQEEEARRQQNGSNGADDNNNDANVSSSSSSPPIVAAVFGEAHLPGLQRLWESGEWRALLVAGDAALAAACAADSDAALLLASSPLLSAPPIEPQSVLSPQAGARRGLLEALLSNSVTEEVLADLDNHLPAIPQLFPTNDEEQQAARGAALPSSPEEVLALSLSAPHPATAARFWTHEIYGTFRMRLAALPIEVLDGLVSWWPGAGPHLLGEGEAPCGADLPPEARSAWGLLAPLRALRPTYGGPGWDAAVGLQLRQLNYELGPPGGEVEEEEEEAASEDSAATNAFFQDV